MLFIVIHNLQLNLFLIESTGALILAKGILVTVLTLDALSLRWAVNFTPQPVYLQGNSPQYPLGRRLGGPQSQSERRGEHSWPYRDSNSNPLVVQPVVIPTSQSCVLKKINICMATAYMKITVSWDKRVMFCKPLVPLYQVILCEILDNSNTFIAKKTSNHAISRQHYLYL
jgi:hypothetical protein